MPCLVCVLVSSLSCSSVEVDTAAAYIHTYSQSIYLISQFLYGVLLAIFTDFLLEAYSERTGDNKKKKLIVYI